MNELFTVVTGVVSELYLMLCVIRSVTKIIDRVCEFERTTSDRQENLLKIIFFPSILISPICEAVWFILESTVVKYWKSLEDEKKDD